MKAQIRLPHSFLHYRKGSIYSNFDNELNDEVTAAIQNMPLVADMTATNYHGLVWFSDELGYWCIEIWQNNMVVQT